MRQAAPVITTLYHQIYTTVTYNTQRCFRYILRPIFGG